MANRRKRRASARRTGRPATAGGERRSPPPVFSGVPVIDLLADLDLSTATAGPAAWRRRGRSLTDEEWAQLEHATTAHFEAAGAIAMSRTDLGTRCARTALDAVAALRRDGEVGCGPALARLQPESRQRLVAVAKTGLDFLDRQLLDHGYREDPAAYAGLEQASAELHRIDRQLRRLANA